MACPHLAGIGRTLRNVASETSLQVLAYNMRRVIAILGAGPLISAIRG